MPENQARVDEIKSFFRQWFSSEIVPKDFQVWFGNPLEEPGIDISRNNLARPSDAVAQPNRDGTRARSGFETAPPLGHSKFYETLRRVSVKESRERAESQRSLGSRIVENVLHLAARDSVFFAHSIYSLALTTVSATGLRP